MRGWSLQDVSAFKNADQFARPLLRFPVLSALLVSYRLRHRAACFAPINHHKLLSLAPSCAKPACHRRAGYVNRFFQSLRTMCDDRDRARRYICATASMQLNARRRLPASTSRIGLTRLARPIAAMPETGQTSTPGEALSARPAPVLYLYTHPHPHSPIFRPPHGLNKSPHKNPHIAHPLPPDLIDPAPLFWFHTYHVIK